VVEFLPSKQGVAGSSPVSRSSRFQNPPAYRWVFLIASGATQGARSYKYLPILTQNSKSDSLTETTHIYLLLIDIIGLIIYAFNAD
jgi:hypothetical protein